MKTEPSVLRARLNLALILVLVLLQMGCTQLQSNDSNTKPTEELPSKELFARKLECEKYANRAREEYQSSWGRVKRADQWQYLVVGMFYSVPRNSCVCALRVDTLENWSENPTTQMPKNRIASEVIIDALTKEVIWQRDYLGDEAAKSAQKDLDEQLIRLTQ